MEEADLRQVEQLCNSLYATTSNSQIEKER